ncbi:MAG: OB-fold domain-containing protein [Myxococcales bacterium]|jgi:uncharacterized OB-fold protein|nr:OB-fold domain-containing protein [Myxococcales bacterium]
MSATGPALPPPDALTAPFWEECRRGVLAIAACADCGHRFLPPGPCCPRCWSRRLAVQEACGRGRVETFAVYRRTYHPALPAPYVVALIALDEGPRLISNVVGCAAAEVAVGMPVAVRFEKAGDRVLPRFAPAGDQGGAS